MNDSVNKQVKEMSFWDHLDDLRWTLMRISIGIIICMAIVFFNKEIVFDDLIFAPCDGNFITYRLMCKFAEWVNFPAICPDAFEIDLINTTVSGQFFTHLSTSFWFGLVLAFPWIIYQLWLFISPALYDNERKNATLAFFAGSFLFFVGSCLGYLLIFPLTVRFLGTYQLGVTHLVPNMINIGSYIDTLVILTLSMGIIFELPILIYILSRLGFVTKAFLREYRRYAIVIILIIAAVITPTADPITLSLVSIPILLLYEFSIKICTR